MFQLRKLNSLLVIIIILILASHALLTGLLLAGLIEYTPNTIVIILCHSPYNYKHISIHQRQD